jgi:hypothetical protein
VIMTVQQRTLLVAVLVATLVGFAVGWYARLYSEPTLESRMHDAAESVRAKVHDIVK